MRDTEHRLPEVEHQYETLPYPARDPALEQQRLVQTWLDDLPMINHYCFAGRQSFRRGFRVLVAGVEPAMQRCTWPNSSSTTAHGLCTWT